MTVALLTDRCAVRRKVARPLPRQLGLIGSRLSRWKRIWRRPTRDLLSWAWRASDRTRLLYVKDDTKRQLSVIQAQDAAETPVEYGASFTSPNMSYRDAISSLSFRDRPPEDREPGRRRRKFAGYLKAANEVRQSYTQGLSDRIHGNDNAAAQDFPGSTAVSNGGEEMIVFPSYARRHVKVKPEAQPGTIQEQPGSGRDVRDSVGAGDAEFWRQQWNAYEDDNAIVDVDVRGWLYIPQSGGLTRRQRLMVALARQLVGISAPSTSPAGTRSRSSSDSASPTRLSYYQTEEEQFAAREADALVRRGEAEVKVASAGGFSEGPINHQITGLKTSMTNMSQESLASQDSDMKPTLSSTEVKDVDGTANKNLMSRLRPFMSTPLPNVTISAFFYNDTTSRQKTFATDSAGHFSFRAALDFVPTHVRILGTDRLSAQVEIKIVEPSGVSLVSDVDDTVRHAAITKGAREIFRNAFIRDLGDLTIPGVKEWYRSLADLGVQVHYVSNSPWQLYPVMTKYFALAGLPLGTFHLKQYSGMLQGIFEPVAERKKASLDKIMGDFPTRRFLLIGDSGEADLEVYTDVVLEHPGRVLGIFIRDVTTSAKLGVDKRAHHRSSSSQTPISSRPPSIYESEIGDEFNSPLRQNSRDQSQYDSMPISPRRADNQVDSIRTRVLRKEMLDNRPTLPPRPSVTSATFDPQAQVDDLIDLSDEPSPRSVSMGGDAIQKHKAPPAPAKPDRLKAPALPPRPDLNRIDTGSSEKATLRARKSMPSNLVLTESNQAQPRRDNSPSPSTEAPTLRRKRSNFSIISDRMSGNWSGIETEDTIQVNKKEELWNQRLDRAREILQRRGVVLRTWRVGEDIMDESIELVRAEMARIAGNKA